MRSVSMLSEPSSADCCDLCGRLIYSARQIDNPGCALCEQCAPELPGHCEEDDHDLALPL